MKTSAIKTMFVLMLMGALSAQAQVNTPEGEIIGGNAKDTAHFVDKPSMHVHEKEKVIKETPIRKAADSTSRTVTGANGRTGGQQAANTSTTAAQDTTPAAAVHDTSSATVSTTTISSETSTTTTSNNCANYIYGALGILLLGAILLLFIFRRKKEN